MVEVGLSATELGPDGWLPTDPTQLVDYVGTFGLRVIGGFVPALLHMPDKVESELAYVDRATRQLAATGSEVVVLAASVQGDGYDRSYNMNDAEWAIFRDNLARCVTLADDRGLVTALHPHWGMAIETQDQVERLLETTDVGLCLDTGHLFLAGADVLELTRMAAHRIHHVHVKDLTEVRAESVRTGEVAFRDAVIDGLFVPAGSGDVDLAGVVGYLEANGYQGWYVLEQDKSLAAAPPDGTGPLDDARLSFDFFKGLADHL
jgi:inosose dehydratase